MWEFFDQPFLSNAGRVSSSPYSALTGLNLYKGSIHLHTTESDGEGTPAQVAAAYVAADFDWIGCTDHDFLTSDTPTADPGGGPLWILGLEETVSLNEHNGHIVVGNIVSGDPGTGTPQDAIDNAPYAQLAHPWSVVGPPVAYFTDAEMLGLTGYESIEIDDPIAPTGWDVLLTAGMNVGGANADDSHALVAYGTRGFFMAYASALTVADVIAALQAQRYYCSKGPTLTIDDNGIRLLVTASAASDFTFIGSGGGTLKTAANATGVSYYYQSGDGYVRCVVKRLSDNAYAWTNAIFVS